jgi:hypothetical protein
MIQDMKTTLTRLFTVMLLIMVSMGAMADVKVLFGEKGDDKVKTDGDKIEATYDGGTIVVTQKVVDATKVTVFLTVTPNKGYTMQEKNVIEAYATAPANIGTTRAPLVSEKLTLDCEDFKDEYSTRTYYVDIDPALALWVKSADFQKEDNGRKSAITGEQDDYSGVYYIASRDFVEANTTTNANFYLCPTEKWAYYQYGSPYYYVYSSGCNTDTPFMTTYQCRDGVSNDADGEPYDARKAIWIVEKEDNYYHIKHAVDGKYLTRNGKMGESSNAGRMRVHLESSPADDDDALFEINWVEGSSCYEIITKKNDGTGKDDSTRKYLNYTGPKGGNGNIQELQGTSARNDGPTNNKNVGGIIGLWTATGDPNGKWYLEEAVEKPVISQATNGDVTITCATSNTTIYYTLNGSDPEVPADGAADPTGPTYKYTAAFTPELGSTGVKAVAVLSDLHAAVSKKAERSFVAYSTPNFSFDGVDKVTISAAHADATIYCTTNGDAPTVDPSLIYDGSPLPVSSTSTVKAIATHTGFLPSDPATFTITQVATPTIQNNGNNAISITSATAGATIYYTTDGSTPTTSSNRYTTPLWENVSNVTIKAIATKVNMLPSEVGSGKVKLKCAAPVITRYALSFTLSCSMPTDATFYYTKGSDPETQYNNSPVTFTLEQLPLTVTAVAKHSDYTDSETTTVTLTKGEGTVSDPYLIYSETEFSDFVDDVNDGTASSAHYKLCIDVSGSGINKITRAFSGSFDGNSHIIIGLTHPLFNTVDGGTVKNVTLKGVAFSNISDDYVGAIAGIAKGYSRIYNCGILPNDAKFPDGTHPTVSTSGSCAGGIVGKIEDDSRVINCYSYADVSATTTASGIVGYNAYVSGTTDGIDYGSTTKVENIDGVDKYTELRTAVVNCMFYGDIIGGSQVYPVYGGAKMLNKGENGINNYNFYRAKASINVGTRFNCSWPASEENLTRFEYYRYLLNSNRELCGWWVNSDVAPNTLTTEEVQAIEKDASLIAKWVLDPSIAPYPILKAPGKYPSVINQDPNKRINPETKAWVDRDVSDNTIETNAAPDTKGQTLGSVEVTIISGKGSSDSRTIKITAMDTDNNDFCYGKIQLPYYNEIFGNPNSTTWSEKYGGNYTSSVVTGWDITTEDGTAGTFSDDPITGNIFADRNSTAKDTYRVFAQGGYYYVPYGVGSITITAHWATAYYLGNGVDGYYDRVWFSNSQSGSAFAPAGTRSFSSGAFGGQSVNNGTIQSVLTSATAASTVYDCALVLVGNHQYKNLTDAVDNSKKPFTIMSVDLDFDNEPDYCLEWQVGSGSTRTMVAPVRFDFLPVVELGVAMKEDASTNLFALGKLTPYGHFEVTETSVIHFGQFEYENNNRTIEAPVILNNGVFDQICRGTDGTNNQHITYFLLGGHVKMPSFTPGAHVTAGNNNKSRHCAVNVLGGEFTKFYLTGNYNNGVTPNEDDPHCYIDGGKLDMVASAAKEGINGSVYWKIDHAYIGEFYGGGISSDKRVTGSIEINIDRSKVTKFCGGPMFGDMYDGQTVTTTATGTTFGVYYGAGNGGTCYSQYSRTENTSSFSLSSYTATKYEENINGVTGMNGYHAKYEFELVNTSAGTDASLYYRTYLFAAQFATTNTGDVSNTLTDCTIETNFFGGGNLGGVTGSVTSELKGHTVVEGNAYGAGYSAKDLSVDVLPKTGYTAPKRDTYTAVISDPVYPDPTPYVWTNETTIGSTSLSTSSPTASSNNTNYLFTEVPLVNLGAVSQSVSLTIGGTSEVHQNVFGGGEESGVDGNTIVTLKGEANISGNVFGGGNKGTVSGSTEVNIQQ